MSASGGKDGSDPSVPTYVVVTNTPISVNDNGGSLTVDGTVTTNAGTGPWPVTDNSGSLTVDATASSFGVNSAQISGTATSVGSGILGTGTQRVVLATDQPVIPVSDNAGSLTVDSGTGSLRVIDTIPVDADVLSGSANVANSVTVTTVITVPAGRTWKGCVSASGAFTSITATATAHGILVKTAGTNPVPAAGTVVCSLTSAGAQGAAGSIVMSDVVVKAPVGNSVTIQMTNASATTWTGSVTCTGVLL